MYYEEKFPEAEHLPQEVLTETLIEKCKMLRKLKSYWAWYNAFLNEK